MIGLPPIAGTAGDRPHTLGPADVRVRPAPRAHAAVAIEYPLTQDPRARPTLPLARAPRRAIVSRALRHRPVTVATEPLAVRPLRSGRQVDPRSTASSAHQ